LNNKEQNKFKYLKPWIGSIIILPLVIFYIINRGDFSVIDFVNLLIHEGGHGIFRIFGEFIYFAGGTIMQMLIPILFVIVYWRLCNRFIVQLSMVWLGENLMNISVYVADARARKLPLLGGNKVRHDWTVLLFKMNILQHDVFIGEIFYYLGIAMFLLALLAPVYFEKTKQINLNLKI
jgi:hypothetical protein